MNNNNYLVSLGSSHGHLSYAFRDSVLVNSYHKKFEDGEVFVDFDKSVRNKHIFIFGETSHKMDELFMTIDGAKRSSASEITVVLPYFGYARQDKRDKKRCSIGSSVMAQILMALGVDRVISIDLHAEQIIGNFHGMPFEHIKGHVIFGPALRKRLDSERSAGRITSLNTVIYSPDAGGVKRAEAMSNRLGIPFGGFLLKKREKANEVSEMRLIGDVKGLNVILVDDIADTCGTLCKAAGILMDGGALSVRAIISHPLINGKAQENVANSQISELIVMDTLTKEYENEEFRNKLFVVESGHALEEVIHRVVTGSSVTELIA